MAKNAKNQAAEDVTRIGEQLAQSQGYELVEAAFEKESTGIYLRFYLDKEGGISLDDCEVFHRAVQPKVERFDYDFLEVCSPGIDRPIRNQRDADRCMGLEIEVRLYKALEGKKTFTGLFTGYENGDITIRDGENERTFLKKDLYRAVYRL